MKKYYSLVLLSVMIALLSSACSSDDEEKQVFTVASKTVVLPYGEGQPTRLYYVKTPSGSTWSPTFIENLDSEPGYEGNRFPHRLYGLYLPACAVENQERIRRIAQYNAEENQLRKP